MRGFIEELRYRNVFRVAIAYVVAGWLIAQVADLAADAFNAPEWFMQMLIVLLLIGLPVVLFLAWAYELTPGGVVRAKDLPEDAPKDPRSGQMLNRLIIAALIIAVGGLVWERAVVEPSAPQAVASDKSIAVLPFADFSPGNDQGWFADGLTDEILNALARTRDLHVASRTSSFAYRGSSQDIPAIAKELNVAHVLEGSVRRAGDRIRVTAQLIRASDDAHLWSETFDASSEDSIEIQEQIAFDIASLLDTAMDPEELRKMVAAGTDSIAAWESYIRMRDLLFRSYEEFDASITNEQVQSLYDETVAEDPEFGEAHLLFAEVIFGWLAPDDITTGPSGLSYEEKRELFARVSADAARYARTEDARLGAEILRARAQVRFADLVDLTRERLAHNPTNAQVWRSHLTALIQATKTDEAKAFVERIALQDFDDDSGLSDLLSDIGRVDVERGLAVAERLLGVTSPSAADLYQSHRVFLYADRVTEAAVLARRYKEVAADPRWNLMVDIRQACAEGRVADADALYADFDFSDIGVVNNNVQWLALKTLSRDAEAEELLRPLDEPATLSSLATLLSYTHFDPRPFPNLAAILEAQGVMRENPTKLNFACRR